MSCVRPVCAVTDCATLEYAGKPVAHFAGQARTMTELHPLDSSFMELEDADRHVSLGIGAVAILSGPPPTRTEVVAAITGRLARQPRLRQRVRRGPLDLVAPVWEDDPDFDVAHHIRWTALPDPGDDAALCEFVATELAERLDRDHPLWQCVVVERLANERWALLIKAHHSLVDGVSGVSLFESLCDETAAPKPVAPAVAESAGSAASAAESTGASWIGALRQGARLPLELPGQLLGLVTGLLPVAYAAVTPAPPSSLIGAIGRQRRYAIARTRLSEAREIGAAFGTTVNDVVLAAVTAAYRTLLLHRGEQPTAQTLRVLVPVSMRPDTAKYVPDNRVSAMLPLLPLDLADPVQRLTTIHEHLARHKASGAPHAEKSLLALADRLPFAPVAWGVRLLGHLPQRGVGAVATNVPGPRRPLTMYGRRVLELLPAVPIALRVRTGIAILSYDDQLNFGITGDYDSTADLSVLAEAVEAEFRTLLARVRRHSPSPV